ncbi:MAG: Rap1a/Tai family immunity protein [Gammaproteobacteria bacterium]|jgi:hypothetical protein
MKYHALLSLLLIFAATGVQSQEQPAAAEIDFPQQISAQDLLLRCNASALTGVGRERRRYCAGFISGIEEAARLLHARGEVAGRDICIPSGTSAARLAGAYRRYAAQNPALLARPAAEVALRALQGAFPCPSEAGQ